ncbi:MAG: transposase [Clostridia bacterium]|nr:transposase [Clostridia bacterium]
MGYTNAFTEGSNNTIKVLKRISYGTNALTD